MVPKVWLGARHGDEVQEEMPITNAISVAEDKKFCKLVGISIIIF
jgi:hypothetical protein